MNRIVNGVASEYEIPEQPKVAEGNTTDNILNDINKTLTEINSNLEKVAKAIKLYGGK